MNLEKIRGKKFDRKKVRLFWQFELFSARTFLLLPYGYQKTGTVSNHIWNWRASIILLMTNLNLSLNLNNNHAMFVLQIHSPACVCFTILKMFIIYKILFWAVLAAPSPFIIWLTFQHLLPPIQFIKCRYENFVFLIFLAAMSSSRSDVVTKSVRPSWRSFL